MCGCWVCDDLADTGYQRYVIEEMSLIAQYTKPEGREGGWDPTSTTMHSS
jgi:hypothetical protein